LNMVPSELMRLRIVALLFCANMKSKYSAISAGVAGRLDWFLVLHQDSY
jgi:hypothetical protein